MGEIRVKYSTVSLQCLCLITVVEHLEHYPPELLACIPPTLRHPLFHHIPIADLCQLERTEAFDGIDAEKIWEERFKDQISPYIHLITNEYNASLILNHTRSHAGDPVETITKSKREHYLETIVNAIFKCARPTGYYPSNGNEVLALDTDHLKQAWSFDFPVDIVNYLVAAVKIEAVTVAVTREPSSFFYNEVTGIELEMPVAEYELKQHLTEPIDRSCYAQVNKLLQYVPHRYTSYINETNDYHLSDENALIFLMEKCNYYPKEMYITVVRYDAIEWSWQCEKRKPLVGQFLSKTNKIELNCTSDYEETVEALKNVLEDILCTPSPKLVSLFLVDVKDAHILAIAPSLIDSTCNLQMLSIDRIETESVSASNELGNIVMAQSMLSSLSLVDISPCSFDVTTRSRFAESIYSLVQRPHFESLSFCGVELANDIVQEVIVAFLSSPCSHAQCVKLRGLYSKFENLDNKYQDLVIPEFTLEHKSLEISLYSRLGIEDWLMSLQPLNLKSLDIDDPFNVLVMS